MTAATARQLILVPGHAVWSTAGDPADASTWHLKPHQNGEVGFFLQHVRAGVELAGAAEDSMLVFSGGATELEAGELSEAAGYLRIAEHYGWWGRLGVEPRTVLEEYALDSFLNLRYSLHRFRQVAGVWPEGISIVGWGFKRRRIAELHRQALNWTRPLHYIAVNEPENLGHVMEREAETCAQFETDPLGERAPIAEKRRARDHFGRVAPYDLTSEEWD
jgi:hypothetical protein